MTSSPLGQVHFEELVRAYLSMGRHMEAMVVAKKAIKELAPFWHPKFYVLIAESWVVRGDEKKAKKAIEAALEIDPAFLPALMLRRRLEAGL